MPKLLVIDDRDQTVEMVHRQLPEFETVTRCDRRIPCQVCEERERGCPLRCAHDYGEAAQALSRLDTLPDLVVLDLHFALPEEKLLPEDKSALPTDPKARKTALDGLRRKQGLLILEKLRASYPTLPVVMLTTTGSDLGAERPADPLVYLCENEVVDSRSLAAEISRALVGSPHRTGGGNLLGTRARDGGAAPAARRAGALAAAAADRRRDRNGQELPGRTGDPPALRRQGSAGGDRSVDRAAGAAGGPPVRRAARRLHGRGRGSRGRVRAGARRDPVPRRDRQPGSRAAAAAAAGARTRRGHATRRHARPARRRPSWWRRPTRTSRRWCTPGGSAPISTCASIPRRGCAYRRCASAARTCPELVRFAFLEALRSEPLRPLVRSYLAQFPTPDDFDESESVHRVRPPARAGGAAGRVLGVHQPGVAGAARRASTGRATTASSSCWPRTRWCSA